MPSPWGVFARRGSQNFLRSTGCPAKTCRLLYTKSYPKQKEKVCQICVRCLPAAASFQSQDKPAPSRKLTTFVVSSTNSGLSRSVTASDAGTGGKVSPRQGEGNAMTVLQKHRQKWSAFPEAGSAGGVRPIGR